MKRFPYNDLDDDCSIDVTGETASQVAHRLGRGGEDLTKLEQLLEDGGDDPNWGSFRH